MLENKVVKKCICIVFSIFVGFALFGCQLMTGGKSSTEEELKARKNPCIVLALPNSGAYAPIAMKIKKGAAVAVEELKKNGINTRIENINTDATNWLQSLEALPSNCVMVGGPLREKKYVDASNSGILSRRVFFSFVPVLRQGDEGNLAWRFFPSPQDQIDTLINFAVNDLNIRTFGSFFPQDSYGSRMNRMLEQSLAKKNLTLRQASYNPASPATWSSAAAILIKPVNGESNQTPIPQTEFEAIFIPDSWKHMDMLIDSLMYNGEDRLVMLGTTLWEQGLAGKKINNPGKYALAVFPCAWSQSKAPASLQAVGNDFWSALGYDFINFAVATGIIKRLASSEISSRAQGASRSLKALAPLFWDKNGHAKQSLYLFQAGTNGIRPLNLEEFKIARSKAQEKAALRMQGLPPAPENTAGELPIATPLNVEQEPIMSTKTSVEEPPKPVVNQPVSTSIPQGQIMSPGPQPSYKLRLPEKN